MELPGLGVFILDPHTHSSEKTAILEGVSFESRPSVRESPELIQFISSETGKMKALAAADLDSHLENARQFLHMGKSYSFEGIGSLVKLRNGEYSFTAGPAMPETVPQKESKGDGDSPEEKEDYKNIFYARRVKSSSKKAVSVLLAICGIAFALWGGYTIYKRTSNNEVRTESPVNVQPGENSAAINPDTIRNRDSVVIPPVATGTQARKFVLETAKAKRAFERYNKLKSFQWKVEMETNDSVLYKLYVKIPALAIDTTRILDSLTRMNGRRVHIE